MQKMGEKPIKLTSNKVKKKKKKETSAFVKQYLKCNVTT